MRWQLGVPKREDLTLQLWLDIRIPSGKAILFNGRLGVIDLLYEYSSFSLIGSTSSATCRSV